MKVFAAVDGVLPPDQLYEVPPVPVSDTDAQPVAVPVMPAVGLAVTVTVCDAVDEHPPDVTVTV